MYQIDNSTAATTQPASTAAGTAGFFTDGNPATSTPATIVPAEWLNSVMMELANVVTGAGLTLAKNQFNQVLSAIKRLGQVTVVLADTGAANAYTAINAIPLVSGTWVDGVVQQVKIAHANTGPSTYAPDGLPAIPIYGLGLQPLQGTELAVGGTAVLVRTTISSVNSGNPICVLFECAGGPSQVAPATQSRHAVQMGQIQTQAGTAFTTGGTAPAFTLTPSPAITSYVAGQRFRVNFNAVGTTGANTLNINGLGAVGLAQYGPDGAINPAVIPGNLLTDVEYNGSLMIVLDPVSSGYVGLLPVSASVASNALTCTLSPTALAFRSGTLSSGAVTPLSTGSLSITVPSGATLGTVSGTQAMLALLVAYNGGTPVLCIANVAGGLDLSEANLISPTTISGSSNSASTIYSASAVSANSPYRVVGYINITEATAGTWATAPTLVQGQGGEAFAAMQSIGFGQTEQDVTVSRAIGTTYYNTTSRPILVNVALTSTATNQSAIINVNGVAFVGSSMPNSGLSLAVSAIVRPGVSYVVPAGSYTLATWKEIR
ncbi:hypothetical protein [Ralstonia sp. Ralssp135]|uniref:hypothetical protein n=1 Tax=Ralstonia sp. Ralssp135 TaxID=3243016 RepID=UPI0039B1249C